MVTKYQMISYLAEDTAKEIAKNGQEWTRYLTTAARLYKIRSMNRYLFLHNDRMQQPVRPLNYGMRR